jgi:hypothetical protein
MLQSYIHFFIFVPLAQIAFRPLFDLKWRQSRVTQCSSLLKESGKRVIFLRDVDR